MDNSHPLSLKKCVGAPLPESPPPVVPEGKLSVFKDLYRFMITAREMDLLEEQLTNRGEAFFHVSGAGHEAVAALNPHLQPQDWLHCHYRDKALMLARGITPEMFFHSLFGKDASHSRGRQMCAHMSDPSKNVLSLVGPVGNNALQAVGVANEIKNREGSPIVLCAMGDGTTQEGEVLEAIAEAVRWELPVLFLIEDNEFSISTLTPQKTLFSMPDQEPEAFYGIPIHRVDGRDTIACYHQFQTVVTGIRENSKPAVVLMKVQRLSNHTNADDQSIYRTPEAIQKIRTEADPIPLLAQSLVAAGVSPEELDQLAEALKKSVGAAAEQSRRSPDPVPEFGAKKELSDILKNPDSEYTGNANDEQLTMLEAMREVLKQRMQEDERITLYGEDVEDPKGDVFGLTRGLTEAFPEQVKNSPLSESTIVGASIGRALAGGRPVAFLQFADFLPLAFNQIISEMGSMYWRTDGNWQCPVIVMITCGGYRPGLGPFHAQTLESVAAHTPGVDVFMPSTAGDAAGLLNAAFDSGRPTLFFYPKSCLNDRSATTSIDVRKQLATIGRARLERTGHDITFVAWGNTVPLCRKAAEALETEGVQAEVIDLRSLAPWDEKAVLESARKTRKLIVVHEDNRTCGMGAEILATVTEKLKEPIQAVRVVRADTHVPFNFSNQLDILPSFKSILTAAAELLDLELDWELPPEDEPGVFRIEAVGSSPSDESVTISEWDVKENQKIQMGDTVATFEADKAVGELLSPVSGEVRNIFFKEGETVKVGTTLLDLKVEEKDIPPPKPITQEQSGTPLLKRKFTSTADSGKTDETPTTRKKLKVGIAGIASALGSQSVPNSEILSPWPDKTDEDIYRSTGVKSRRKASEGEDVLSLGLKAAQKVLKDTGVDASALDLIICSTGTPREVTPSLACQILYGLAGENAECPAYDINAACSGYIYGLQFAYDFLQSQPEAKVLLVTTEVLSPLLNPKDFDTAIIFGDAATATLIYGTEASYKDGLFQVHRPEISGQGESGEYLKVPLCDPNAYISMNGKKVFAKGVRKMLQMLQRACAKAQLPVEELDLIVPHQANQRIIDAIESRLALPADRMYSNIENLGNTSSNTIPLCLEAIAPNAQSGQRLGLTAFGGGFTYGACLLEVI